MKKNLLILPLLFFLIIFGIFFYLLTTERNPSEIPSILINKKTPKFEAESLMTDKKFISVKEFGNEAVLVNFFATWCKPCRDEHVYIMRFANEEGVKVIGINYKDNPKKTINWLNDLGNPYSNVILDENGKIAIDWGVYGIPETFVVNSKGFIKYRQAGPITKEIYNKINSIIEKNK